MLLAQDAVRGQLHHVTGEGISAQRSPARLDLDRDDAVRDSEDVVGFPLKPARPGDKGLRFAPARIAVQYPAAWYTRPRPETAEDRAAHED